MGTEPEREPGLQESMSVHRTQSGGPQMTGGCRGTMPTLEIKPERDVGSREGISMASMHRTWAVCN